MDAPAQNQQPSAPSRRTRNAPERPPARQSWWHSPVLSGFLAVSAAAVGVWGALAQKQSKERGDENGTLRETISSLQRQNEDLNTANQTLTREVAKLRGTPQPTTPPSGKPPRISPAEIEDSANWRIPAGLHGTWSGTVTAKNSTDRFVLTLTLNGDGLGKGGQAGTVRVTAGSECVMKLFLIELRIDGSVEVDPDEDNSSGTCHYRVAYNYVLSLRDDGRIWLTNSSVDGALDRS